MFGKTGFGAIDQSYGSKSSSTSTTNYPPRGFWMPAEATKRVIFVDKAENAPFCFHEHNLWAITKNAGDKVFCLKKNGLDERGCPLCEAEMWSSFVGYFSVIDCGDVKYERDGTATLTGWTSNKGITYNFDKKLFAAKRGGRDKPGILVKLQRLAQKRGGSLHGCVFDIYRSGAKTESCGDEFEFVTQLNSDEEIKAYLVENGCTPDQMPSSVSGFDWEQVMSTDSNFFRSYDDLNRLVGGGNSSDDDHDDLPF